jgi:MFS family permease
MHHLHLDLHKIHLIKNELQEVYLNLVIQSFALSLITIFVPIYLIKLGYSLESVLLFVMVELGTLSFFSPFAALFAKKAGFKHMILYRTPLLIAYFAGLYAIPSINIPIYAIAFAGGVGSSIYWTSLHSLFAAHSDKIHRASQSSKLISMPGIAALIGPSLGGIIAVAFGFNVLISVAVFFLVISVVPLFFTDDMKPHIEHFSLGNIFSRKYLKFLLAFAAQGAKHIVWAIIWPVFIYFALKEITSVGYVATVAAAGTIIFTLIIGKISDRVDKRSVLRKGAFLASLAFFLMMFATSKMHIFAVSFFAGMSLVMIDVPFRAIFYDKANEENIAEVVVMREVGLGIGRLGIILILLAVLNKFAVGFSIGGIASLFFIMF